MLVIDDRPRAGRGPQGQNSFEPSAAEAVLHINIDQYVP
jgi:hypothetical protein